MTMQPDLTRPGAAIAFAAAVDLFTQACAREDDDEELIATFGFGLSHLVDLTGGDRDTLLIMVRDAAAEAVKVAAGMQRPS